MDSSPKTPPKKSDAESHERTPANRETLLLLYVYGLLKRDQQGHRLEMEMGGEEGGEE